jgi:serine/threonine protein kinase
MYGVTKQEPKPKQMDQIHSILLIPSKDEEQVPKGSQTNLSQEQFSNSSKMISRFQNLLVLSHPFLSSLIQVQRIKPDHLIVYSSYKKECRKLSTIKEVNFKKLASSVLLALDYLHDNKIICQNIQLKKLVVNHSGNVKLLDWGLHYITQGLVEFPIGNIHYFSQESIDGNGVSKSDVYSLGVLLYDLYLSILDLKNGINTEISVNQDDDTVNNFEDNSRKTSLEKDIIPLEIKISESNTVNTTDTASAQGNAISDLEDSTKISIQVEEEEDFKPVVIDFTKIEDGIFKDFLKGCLKESAKDRSTVKALLSHEYLKDIEFPLLWQKRPFIPENDEDEEVIVSTKELDGFTEVILKVLDGEPNRTKNMCIVEVKEKDKSDSVNKSREVDPVIDMPVKNQDPVDLDGSPISLIAPEDPNDKSPKETEKPTGATVPFIPTLNEKEYLYFWKLNGGRIEKLYNKTKHTRPPILSIPSMISYTKDLIPQLQTQTTPDYFLDDGKTIKLSSTLERIQKINPDQKFAYKDSWKTQRTWKKENIQTNLNAYEQDYSLL